THIAAQCESQSDRIGNREYVYQRWPDLGMTPQQQCMGAARKPECRGKHRVSQRVQLAAPRQRFNDERDDEDDTYDGAVLGASRFLRGTFGNVLRAKIGREAVQGSSSQTVLAEHAWDCRQLQIAQRTGTASSNAVNTPGAMPTRYPRRPPLTKIRSSPSTVSST